MRITLAAIVGSTVTACASMNAYEYASKRMLREGQAVFCWEPTSTPYNAKACNNDAAQADLGGCLSGLRATATLFTDVEAADAKLALCMQQKGWQRVLVSGVIVG